jgi:4-hydroxy-tetrahydrodipicolinate synthase
MFSGSYVALVTPFKNNEVDFEKLKELVEFHIKNGSDGLVPCGTTGESATLSHEEHQAVIETTVKAAHGRIKVVAGTGSNCTDEAIHLTKFAEKVGCDGALLVAPYYNKPTQKGLYLHFRAIADAVKIPLMLYNIQSRTAINMAPETIAHIAHDCKNVTSIKEASGSLDQVAQIRALCPSMDILSGDDALTLPVMSLGGAGVVSVVANIVPAEVVALVKAFASGDIQAAQAQHYKLQFLVKSMFLETNPIPVKTAMGMLGMCAPDLRLPMCAMEDATRAKLEKALRDHGLLTTVRA